MPFRIVAQDRTPATAEWIAQTPSPIVTESLAANLLFLFPDRLPSVLSAVGEKINS